MESDYSDEEMNSTEKEVSDVLLRISEFNVSKVSAAIDNAIQYDECFNMSESLDNLISEICEINITNSDYLNKKALIMGLALKCSKKLNKISFRDMQQHIKSKNDEVQILKERLVALEKLVTTNSEKSIQSDSEIQKTPTTKINQIKRTKISPQKAQREKKKVEEKNENLEIEEFPEIQIEKVISPSNENLEEIDESISVEKKQKRVPSITIDESLNTPALLDEISAIVGAKIQARMTNGKL
ncbi:hypothetical protein NPIL_107771 [Nephila pilipes]|uniref:Uncharacterized protein n=1 Tax=Nephila pilipes TaxID=299642 RepID=A0A8X6UQ36_NEPPI|nr:hypothetical protein NPIL_107771 [Nephila pilipes]